MKFKLTLLTLLFTLFSISAQDFSRVVRPYIKTQSKSIAIRHVKVIDGTGGPVKNNQTIVFTDGIIVATGDFNSTNIPEASTILC